MIQLQLHPIPASPQFASASDDEDSMDGQFASLSVFGKLPGVRDVLVSPTNSVGSIVRPQAGAGPTFVNELT